MANISRDAINNVANKLTNWYNIVIFLVLIGSGIGNYIVSDYRHDQHEREIEKLDIRLKKREEINYELLANQLQDIQETNEKLNNKLDETNGRIDKVLEILSSR